MVGMHGPIILEGRMLQFTKQKFQFVNQLRVCTVNRQVRDQISLIVYPDKTNSLIRRIMPGGKYIQCRFFNMIQVGYIEVYALFESGIYQNKHPSPSNIFKQTSEQSHISLNYHQYIRTTDADSTAYAADIYRICVRLTRLD